MWSSEGGWDDRCLLCDLEEKSVQSFERKCEGKCHAFSKGLWNLCWFSAFLVWFGRNFVETVFTETERNCVHFMAISSLKFDVQVLHSICKFYENQCRESCTFHVGINAVTFMCMLWNCGILKLKKALVKFVCWCSAVFAVLLYIHSVLCFLFQFLHWQSQKQQLFNALCCIFYVAMLLLTGVTWTSHSSSVTNTHKFIANTDKWKCLTVFTVKDKQRFSHVTFEAVITRTLKCPKVFSRREAWRFGSFYCLCCLTFEFLILIEMFSQNVQHVWCYNFSAGDLQQYAGLTDMKRIKVSPPKPGCLYPCLSDIEATTETESLMPDDRWNLISIATIYS
jgi:hypothetical protein